MALLKNRIEAGERLKAQLAPQLTDEAIIYALPRGGVPIGHVIATSCGFPLDLLLTKKIGHPTNKEYAIGAVTLDSGYIDMEKGIPKEYIAREIIKIRQFLSDRYQRLMKDRKPQDVKSKVAVIVDDGIATGHTMLAAVKTLRKKQPAKIIMGVPVAPAKVLEELKQEVEETICLFTPVPFVGVGKHYDHFEQLDDEHVIAFLNDANSP